MRSIVFLVALILSGCTTALWSTNYQEEKISGFYVNTERNELLVAGRNDGYLFPIDDNFKDVLLLSRQIEFSPVFDNFAINRKNEVTGELRLLVIEKNISQDTSNLLRKLGFKKGKYNIIEHELTVNLAGKRYEINGELPLQKLEKEHLVMLARPDSFIETAGKIIATPATITIDASVAVPAAFIGALIMAVGSP